MAGIYIHIPFCKSRCSYCAFYSTTSLELRQRYVDAVCREMEKRGDGCWGDIETIYIGGGTPSQLTIQQLEQLFLYINKVSILKELSLRSKLRKLSLRSKLRKLSLRSKLSRVPEITIEVNPDDVTESFANGLRTLPVNRVSMGAQTFSDKRLQLIHRRHTAVQVALAVKRLREAGIGNVSIDLMYGFPGETLEEWQHDIDAALSLRPEHLSAYCLSYEEGTALYEQMRKGVCSPVDEETERAMYDTLIDRLAAEGFEHYELSNFARPGHRSKHNSSYWTGIPYIGLGAAAHSFDGQCRSWNVSDLRQYIEGIERGERLFEEERLEGDTYYNDRVTVALRTREGLNLAELSAQHHDYCLSQARRFLESGLLRLDGERLCLTREGLFVSNMVMSELMAV